MSDPRPPLRAVLAHKWFHAKKWGLKVYGKLFAGKLRRERYLYHQGLHAERFRPMVSSPEFNGKPKLIFLHIPKTAGMSFAKLAETHYPGATSISLEGEVEPDQWNLSRVVGGHFQYICYEAAGPRHVFLAVLRDPVERALSLFRFYAQYEPGRDVRERQGYDHTSLRNTLCNSIYEMDFMHNLQCRYLANRTHFADTLQVIQSRPFIVGTFDQLDDWLEVIASEFGWPEQKLPVINRIAREKPTCEDPKVLAMLQRHNTQDQLLYDYVQERGVFNSLPADFDRNVFNP